MLRHRTGIHEQLKRQKNALKHISVSISVQLSSYLWSLMTLWKNDKFKLGHYMVCTMLFGMFCTLRPRHAGQIFVYFAKKIGFQFRETSAPSDFYPTKFWWALTIFKGAIILPRGRIKFCQAWNLIDFPIYKPQFEGSNQSGKFYLAF